jgi:2'-5' RNA ligase
LIKELAQRYDAPGFEPHVTLAGGEMSEERAREILRNLSVRQPIELEITGIKHSEKYTKTLFVQFRSVPQIEALGAEIHKAAGSDYKLNPHLSLLYKEMPDDEKAQAAREISFPFDCVMFEVVTVIVTPTPIRKPDDIQAWRTLGSRRLDTAPE